MVSCRTHCEWNIPAESVTPWTGRTGCAHQSARPMRRRWMQHQQNPPPAERQFRPMGDRFRMRTNSVMLAALLALAVFGAGIIVGGRLAARRAATSPSPTNSASAGAQAGGLPAMKARPRVGSSGAAAASGEASVAEIEAALQKLARLNGAQANRKGSDQRLVWPAQTPVVLDGWPCFRQADPMPHTMRVDSLPGSAERVPCSKTAAKKLAVLAL